MEIKTLFVKGAEIVADLLQRGCAKYGDKTGLIFC